MRNVAVVGAGGHAKVVIDIIEKAGLCAIVGLIDKFHKADEEILGYKVIGAEDNLPTLLKQFAFDALIMAIGDNFKRREVVQRIRDITPDLGYISTIHPSAVVGKGVTLGVGSVLMAGAVVNPDCHIGAHCILNTHCSLDHDSQLGNFVSLAPHAAVGGGVSVGTCSSISIGASVKHGVSIGEHTVIGAGAAVVNDIAGHCVAYGIPARVEHFREPGDPYL